MLLFTVCDCSLLFVVVRLVLLFVVSGLMFVVRICLCLLVVAHVFACCRLFFLVA